MSNLSLERLKELFEYNPGTGIFIRKARTANRMNEGAVSGCKNSGYLVIKIDGRNYKAHRLAYLYVHGKFPAGDTDHINGIKDDNRIINLRDVSHRVNIQNQTKRKRDNPDIPMGVRAVKWNGIIGAYISYWCDNSSKINYSPSFNLIKCGGEEQAINLALEYREARLAELISEGASYTDRHGK